MSYLFLNISFLKSFKICNTMLVFEKTIKLILFVHFISLSKGFRHNKFTSEGGKDNGKTNIFEKNGIHSKQKQIINIEEGSNIVLSCPKGQDKFEACIINHDEKCRFEQKFVDGDLTDKEIVCQSTDRYVFEFNSAKCEIKIKNVKMEDGGKWTCEWKIKQENSGPVKKMYGQMILYTTTTATKIAYPSEKDSPITEEDGFKLTTFGSNPTFVHTENGIILSCKVSSYYKTCVFKHGDKTCKLKWEKEKGMISVSHSFDFNYLPLF